MHHLIKENGEKLPPRPSSDPTATVAAGGSADINQIQHSANGHDADGGTVMTKNAKSNVNNGTNLFQNMRTTFSKTKARDPTSLGLKKLPLATPVEIERASSLRLLPPPSTVLSLPPIPTEGSR